VKPVRSRVNRRAFLRGAGTVAVGLPFLEGVPERSAFAQNDNPVFGLFVVTSCGVVQKPGGGSDPEKFWPPADGALTTESMNAFAADRCTGILAPHASRLLILRGINYPHRSSGCGHAQGLVQSLTSSQPNGGGNTSTASGISIDTHIAKAVNPQGVDPLALYAGMKGGYINEKVSFSAAGQVRAMEGNPWNVYQRLMGLATPSTGTGGTSGTGGSGGSSGMADPIVLQRKSVNDLVREDMKALLARTDLSSADRMRLDQHLQSIRDMENTIIGMGRGCTLDGLDTQTMQMLSSGNAFRNDSSQEQVSRLQMELAAFAFACNATRVAVIQVGDGTDASRYTLDGQKVERFHYISHRIQGDGTTGAAIPQAVEWHTAIDRIRMEGLKGVLDKWAAYDTVGGPLLDRGFLMWTSHVATGPAHSFNNLPIIIAGSAGGYLKQGQFINGGNVTNNRLFNTLATAMGVPTTNFGGSGLTGGELDVIKA
jgi:hypothetical protein